MESNSHIVLNMQAPNVAVVVNAKQGDKLSRVITAELVDGDVPFIPPEGVEAVVRYFKPDNTIGFYDVTENGEKAVVIDGSEIIIALAEQALTVPGNVYAEINFYTSLEKLTTFNFIIHVQKSAVSDQVIESTDYFSVLTQKINALLGASTNPPYINATTKNWMIWSENTGEYVDSGFSSIGLIPPSTVTYQVGTNGTTPPTGTWTTTIPNAPQGSYLWTRTMFEFSDGSEQMSYSVARQGLDGSGSVSAVFGVGPDATGNVNPAPFTGIVKSTGTGLQEAAAGVDYQMPIAAGSIERSKLATDALYSPVKTANADYTITSEDIGKTLRTALNSGSSVAVNFVMSQEQSASIPVGAEIAILRWTNGDCTVEFTDALAAWNEVTTGVSGKKFRPANKYDMIAIKKITAATSGDTWLVTGNMEAVT